MIIWKTEHKHRIMNITTIKENWPPVNHWWEAIFRKLVFVYLDWWVAQTGKLIDRGVFLTGVLPLHEDEEFLKDLDCPTDVFIHDDDCDCTPRDGVACAAEEEIINQIYGDAIPVPGLDPEEEDRCA